MYIIWHAFDIVLQQDVPEFKAVINGVLFQVQYTATLIREPPLDFQTILLITFWTIILFMGQK